MERELLLQGVGDVVDGLKAFGIDEKEQDLGEKEQTFVYS